MTSSVIEETMKRIQSHKGVEAILIVDNDGHVIQSNLKERSEEHAALLCQLVRPSFARAGSVSSSHTHTPIHHLSISLSHAIFNISLSHSLSLSLTHTHKYTCVHVYIYISRFRVDYTGSQLWRG